MLLNRLMPFVIPKYALVVIISRQIKRIINSNTSEDEIPKKVATISAINGNESPNPTPAPARIPNIKKHQVLFLKDNSVVSWCSSFYSILY